MKRDAASRLGAPAPRKEGLQGEYYRPWHYSSANCDRDVATDEVPKASRARAPDSPMSGEGRSPNGPTDEEGGQGPDGGVDLGLTKNGQRFLVQCKHWHKRQVGVTVVRELNGVVSAQGAHGGFVVTGGEFSREAREFADACGIRLIDGPKLEDCIAGIPSRNSAADSGAAVAAALKPVCPQCGTAMIQRTAKKGQFAGQPFWGCGRYPMCSGIVHIS